MVDAILGACAVLVSLVASLLMLKLQKDRPVESRGMVGLAATVAHLMLSLALPALVWIVRKPMYPLAFMGGVLAFYWLSLIILVLAIIRWLRGAGEHLETPGTNSRQNTI